MHVLLSVYFTHPWNMYILLFRINISPKNVLWCSSYMKFFTINSMNCLSNLVSCVSVSCQERWTEIICTISSHLRCIWPRLYPPEFHIAHTEVAVFLPREWLHKPIKTENSVGARFKPSIKEIKEIKKTKKNLCKCVGLGSITYLYKKGSKSWHEFL